jgi:hypothetical protein
VVLRRQNGYKKLNYLLRKKPEDAQGHIYSSLKNLRNVIYQWLPAPEGIFFLVLRMYLPAEQILNET